MQKQITVLFSLVLMINIIKHLKNYLIAVLIYLDSGNIFTIIYKQQNVTYMEELEKESNLCTINYNIHALKNQK